MADRIIVGYWDCPYCGGTKIKGTLRECPSCGRARGEETEFYMDVNNKEYVNDEESKKYGNGEDWFCPYCGSYNANEDTVCKSCGYSRGTKDKEYSDIRGGIKKNGQDGINGNRDRDAAGYESRPYNGLKNSGRNPVTMTAVIMAVIMVVIILGISAYNAVRPETFACEDYFYQSCIDVEEHQRVSRNGWTLPPDAEDVTKKEEIRDYETVIDHYESVRKSREVPDGGHYEDRTEYRTVPDGGHYEYSYSDNGDGTFTEHSTWEDDYTTEPYTVSEWVQDYRTEYYTEDEPVYKEVPVYDTKYYYYVWEWTVTDTLKMTKHDKNIEYPVVESTGKQRPGAKDIVFFAVGTLDEKESDTYRVPEDFYMKMEKGKTYTVRKKFDTLVEADK